MRCYLLRTNLIRLNIFSSCFFVFYFRKPVSLTSPPVSGRSSPCLGSCPTTVVALDCEMVGTGPGGRCSELARCSILDYRGHVLYDKYVRPCLPVTDYRTRWSGIRRHHLHNATPFVQAREEIISILEGKVIVGHSIYNDFDALDVLHPCHMVRDTSTARLLSRLAGFPGERCPALKILACKLLNRRIQVRLDIVGSVCFDLLNNHSSNGLQTRRVLPMTD
uniref:Interferon stimulated exonuclease gene n=1 Tax=Scophthalmus maximus TaxID=52904 RepID=A0A8D3C308_SCOMX